jgi:hypothetical protein
MRVFAVSCLKNPLGDNAFEGVEKIKGNATQQLIQIRQANFRRCLQQRKSLWNKLIQAEGQLFRMDQYVMTVTSVKLVRQRQPCAF